MAIKIKVVAEIEINETDFAGDDHVEYYVKGELESDGLIKVVNVTATEIG